MKFPWLGEGIDGHEDPGLRPRGRGHAVRRGVRGRQDPLAEDVSVCGGNRALAGAAGGGTGGLFFLPSPCFRRALPGLPRPKIVRSKLTIWWRVPAPFACARSTAFALLKGWVAGQLELAWRSTAAASKRRRGGVRAPFGPEEGPQGSQGIRPDLYLRPTSATALPPRPPAARGGLRAAQGELDPELGRPTPASAGGPPPSRSTFRDEIS